MPACHRGGQLGGWLAADWPDWWLLALSACWASAPHHLPLSTCHPLRCHPHPSLPALSLPPLPLQASGLARRAISVYQAYIEMMNDDIKRAFTVANPFHFKHISHLKSAAHFDDVGPCVVMATPSMLQVSLSGCWAWRRRCRWLEQLRQTWSTGRQAAGQHFQLKQLPAATTPPCPLTPDHKCLALGLLVRHSWPPALLFHCRAACLASCLRPGARTLATV